MKKNVLTSEDRSMVEELKKIILSVSDKTKEKFVETVAYGMPAYRYKTKIVCCYLVCKNHLGFYPYSSNILLLPEVKKDLTKFEWSKGAVRFPKDKKMPIVLIRKLLKGRMREINAILQASK